MATKKKTTKKSAKKPAPKKAKAKTAAPAVKLNRMQIRGLRIHKLAVRAQDWSDTFARIGLPQLASQMNNAAVIMETTSAAVSILVPKRGQGLVRSQKTAVPPPSAPAAEPAPAASEPASAPQEPSTAPSAPVVALEPGRLMRIRDDKVKEYAEYFEDETAAVSPVTLVTAKSKARWEVKLANGGKAIIFARDMVAAEAS